MESKTSPIKNYLGYFITTSGEVIGKRGSFLVPYKRPDGYLEISLYRTGDDKKYKRDKWLIHQLVALHFLPHDIITIRLPKGIIINHKNLKRDDNRTENLEFSTYRDNTIHAIENGTMVKNGKKVRQITMKGEIIKEFDSVVDAKNKTGISLRKIYYSCKNPGYEIKGYKWQYVENEYIETPTDLSQWENIKGFEKYRISQDGRIFSERKTRLLSTSVRGKYLRVSLSVKGQCHIKPVHVLVAEAYINKPDINEKLVVNHKNGDGKDNRVENLEWTTHRGNSQHAIDTGLCPRPKGKSVIQYNMGGEELCCFQTIKEASEKTGAHPDTITLVCNKRRNKSGGYKWEWGHPTL